MYRRVLPILLIGLSACGKHGSQPQGMLNTQETASCIERIKLPFTGWLTQGGIDSANALFAHAGRGDQDLAPLTFEVTGPTAQVMAIQFIDGLPVLDNDVVFAFYNGALTADSVVITARPLSGDTAGHQSFEALRTAFLAHISESRIFGGPSNAQPSPPPVASAFADTCLEVALGYIDTVSVPGTQINGGKYLVKIWSVSPVNSIYPRVYVEDAGGKAWGVSLYLP